VSGSVHLIGIGGVGMSALAQTLLEQGVCVTGADRLLNDASAALTPALARLAAQGVALFPDDGSGVTAATREVIVSTAIEADNPGLVAARARGIPVTHRAAALAAALAPYRLVAVAGTCGKSTVTAMLGHVLAGCGFDPFVVNGAAVPGWKGGVRPGKGTYAVAEVDESDKSLTAFRPYAAVVTNASADHYSLDEMNEVFDAFVKDVPGPVIDGRKVADLGNEVQRLAAQCPLPGAHNRQNAAHAAAMALALGAKADDVARALATFPGVERRLQRIGTFLGETAGAVVYDDYAHNPEKLQAMLVTLQEAHPQGVAVVWRPHGYGPLRKMGEALAAMFRATLRPCDALWLLPVYDAGGTADRSVNSDALLARLAGVPAALAKDLTDAEALLRAHASAFGAMVTAGARDPGLPILARRLTERT